MTNIIGRAREIIRSAATHPDPVGAMRALEAETPPGQRHYFTMLWEGLQGALSRAEMDRGADDHD